MLVKLDARIYILFTLNGARADKNVENLNSFAVGIFSAYY